MAGHLPEIIICIFFFTVSEGAFVGTSAKHVLRGAPPAHGIDDPITKQELFHHHEVVYGDRHQAHNLLAVTDDAFDSAWKDQVHSPKQDDYDGNMCQGSQYIWMASMMHKCEELFGAQSYWDHQRRPFCQRAFQQCQPYYAQCCTQPEGATTLGAYCDMRSQQNHLQEDPACTIEPKIQIIQDAISKIPKMASRILLSKPSAPANVNDPWDYRTEGTLSTVAEESYHDKAHSTTSRQDDKAEIDESSDSGKDQGASFIQGKRDKTGIAVRAPEVEASAGPQVENGNAEANEGNTATNAEARAANGSGNSQPEQWQRIFAAPSREAHCNEMSRILSEMNEALRQLSVWRAMNTGDKYDPGSVANQDPQLLTFIDDLVAAGKLTKQRANACSSSPEEEREEDAEEHNFLQSAQSPTGADQGIVINEITRSHWKLVETDVKRLTNRMNGYMGFIGFMNFHVSSIEGQVHPHGDKWWRYRYEQTLMESFFHIPAFMVLICLQRLIGHITAPRSGRQRKLCISHFYQHLSRSGMHNAMAVAIMMFAVWAINATTLLFDLFAIYVRLTWEACIDKHTDRCIFESVPFSGNAYYEMWMGIAMNLLATCMFYSLCVWEFLRVSIQFLERLSASEQPPSRERLAVADTQELEHYFAFQEFFCSSLAKMKKSDRLRTNAKAIGLDLDRNLSKHDLKHDLENVKFHRYLVVSLDHASHDFVLWSPALMFTLVGSCFLVAIFAASKKLSFAWFLPGILAMLLSFLVLAILLKQMVWACTNKETSEASMPWLTSRRWIIAVQTVVFLLCYSFARLMFSKSIWNEYTSLAFYCFVGFVLLIVCAHISVRDLMMRMVCVLSLPPNASAEMLEEYLEQMATVALDVKGDGKSDM